MDDVYLQELIREEGIRLRAYDDANGMPIVPGYTLIGHPTIGSGRALDTNGLTSAEAQYLFTNDVREIEAALGLNTWWPTLSPLRQFVISSMAFNMGLAGLMGFAKMIAAIKVRNYSRAAMEMAMSSWAKQLPERSQRLATMMRSGVMPSG